MNDNPGSTTSAAGSRTAPSGEGPLNGIRVIEIGSMVAGPVACTLLGDFGAEVIKVEPPGKGDPIRAIACDVPQQLGDQPPRRRVKV